MDVIEKIRQHPLYIENYNRISYIETDRKFCRHQMQHLLDVARIAYILNLEKKLSLKKEVIYSAAILHDIGKARQYQEGVPHETAGAIIAEKILTDINIFSKEENTMILQAISEHRKFTSEMSLLGRLLYESDKMSRACYLCLAEPECNWSNTKKNKQVHY
jgi:uncharacterized protein